MFDLNLSIGSNWKENFEEGKSTVAVTTTSSVVNGEEGSSNNGTWSTVTRATPENSYTFNFGILRRNDLVEKDRYLTEPEQVTRELFPVSGFSEYMNMGRPNNNNGNGNWIDQRVVPRKLVQQQHQQVQHVKPKKSRRGPPSRSSQYRGVTFYRRTGRWESHIWDCGKQIYLGGFDTALAAARAYDRAAIKFRGVDADINFNLREYEEEINQMKSLSKEELVHILRRGSTGFTRGGSKYKGVRWEARMEQFHGKKAYNKAAVQCNGRDAVTDFEPSKYGEESTSEPPNEGIVGSKYDTNYAGSQNDLDLNLGISNSSPKENESERLALLQFQPYDVQNARKSKLQMDPPLPLLTSEYPTSLAGLNPNCFSFYEEKGAEKRIEVSQGLPEWGWRVDGGATPMAMAMFSAAASSGFSSPATTALSASASS